MVRGVRGSYSFPVAGACLCLLLSGCADSGGPNDLPDPLQLAVVVRVDSATFRSAGEFALDLVPSDHGGRTYVTEPWTITTTLSTPVTASVDQLSQEVEPADSQSIATAILIDDSGSMRTSDPDRIRAVAAQLFWRDLLPSRPGNIVALLDFGRGSVDPTPGFQRTNLLAGFTGNAAVLDAALSQIEAVPGGATPLYRSGVEVVRWIDTTTSQAYRRTLVIITDGASSDTTIADTLYDVAVAHGVRAFAVGVGPAAEEGEAARRLQELAARTGGIYAAAEPPEELEEVLRTLAISASPTRLLVRLRLDLVPTRGTSVRGEVALSGERGNLSGEWSFLAP
jgi:Mg-chelatase subunit ChlD